MPPIIPEEDQPSVYLSHHHHFVGSARGFNGSRCLNLLQLAAVETSRPRAPRNHDASEGSPTSPGEEGGTANTILSTQLSPESELSASIQHTDDEKQRLADHWAHCAGSDQDGSSSGHPWTTLPELERGAGMSEKEGFKMEEEGLWRGGAEMRTRMQMLRTAQRVVMVSGMVAMAICPVAPPGSIVKKGDVHKIQATTAPGTFYSSRLLPWGRIIISKPGSIAPSCSGCCQSENLSHHAVRRKSENMPSSPMRLAFEQ
ncbi:hypothetical protein EX30DRAFT_363137 [Ascodesmis nigricans]|uniref:Uncharacterized protein n=1 Tax=Ascodesmis nigricans TaxID=341454 RepID=A0A4S2N0K7_9PEZI|nr:hypothetical protein EX30DRAFT_363137 [Ascodesmis nigricans]